MCTLHWLSGRSTQIQIFDNQFRYLATSVWIPVLVFFLLAAMLWLLMSRTVVGRHLYALGGNETATRLSGVRTERLKWLAYSISALTSRGRRHLVHRRPERGRPANARPRLRAERHCRGRGWRVQLAGRSRLDSRHRVRLPVPARGGRRHRQDHQDWRRFVRRVDRRHCAGDCRGREPGHRAAARPFSPAGWVPWPC